MQALTTRAGILLTALLAPLAAFADRSHPGWVDLGHLAAIDPADEVVNLRLDGWLLGFAKRAADESNDPDARILSGIDSIHVRIFAIDHGYRELADRAADLVSELRADAWEPFATVRGRDRFVYVMVKGSNRVLDGITLVALDNGHEAVFVNIAGRLHPDDVARIIDSEDLIHADIDLSLAD